MKIAIISPFAIGQIDPNLEKNIRPVTWTENLIKGLSKLDETEVHMIVGISPRLRNFQKYLVKDNVKFHFFVTSGRFSPYFFYLYEILRVKTILKKIKPDIVHGQGVEGHSGATAILSGYPNIITIHGILNEIYCDKYWDMFLLKLLERIALKLAKNIIAITPHTTEVVKRIDRNGFLNKRIFNIPNPVAEQFFTQKSVRITENVCDKNCVNILYSGVFSPRKGLFDLLKALHILETKNYKINLFVIGIFDKQNKAQVYLSEIKKYIKNNIKNEVELLGYVNPLQVPALLKKMDIFVLPSKVESFSMAIAEAMAAGLPVVAYKTQGPKHLIKDGETGFIVELNNINELSNKIEILIKDKVLRQRMGNQAMEEAYKRFYPEIVASQTIEAYQQILKEEE